MSVYGYSSAGWKGVPKGASTGYGGGTSMQNLVSTISAEPKHHYDILVYKTGSTYYAQDWRGNIKGSSTTLTTLMTTAFNALTSGRTSKETVYCKGELTTTGTIQVPAYTRLYIDKLLVANNTDADAIQNLNKNVSGDSHIEIHIGELDGNRSGQGTPANCGGVIMSGASGSKMSDILITGWIHNCYRSGVHLRYADDYVIDVLSTDNGTDASLDHNVYVLFSGYGQIRGIMKDASASGVKISDSSGTTGEMLTVDVVSYSNGDNGVHVGDSDHIEVLGLYKNNDTGIRLVNSKKCKVNAVSTTNNQYGVYLDDASYNTIDAISMNNGQTTTNRNGLHMTDICTYNKITGIYSDDQATPTQSRGIREGGTSNWNLVSDAITVGNIDAPVTLIGANSRAEPGIGYEVYPETVADSSLPVTPATGAQLADLGVRTGIVSAYVFAGNTNDSVGANNLTATGAPTYADWKWGQHIILNGSTQYLQAGANTVFDQTTGDFSISFWIYHTADEALDVNAYVVSKRSTSGAGYSIRLQNDKVRGEIYDGSGSAVTTTTAAALDINTWYHVSVVFDRDALCTIYLNGLANGTPQSITTEAGSLTNTQTFTAGRFSDASQEFLAAQIDDLRIYSTALTAAQALRLFSEVSPGQIFICTSTGSGYTQGNWLGVPIENTQLLKVFTVT